MLAVEEDGLAGQQSDQIIPTGLRRMTIDRFPVAKIDGLDERIDVDVAVLDSGIQTDHPDLNVVQAVDFTGQGVFGTNPHGTECAGIIAALDNDSGVVGVAPGARLWSVRVIRENGGFFHSDLLSGFNYAAAHADQIAVVNCSLNTFYGNFSPRVSYQQAVGGLVSNGVVIVASAGNDSHDIAGPDGVLGDDFGGFTDDSLPAAMPEVMAVSAMDPVTDQLAPYSNFSGSSHVPAFVSSPGGAIDVAAPGNSIVTTTLGSGYISGFTGTSASAPHVAGLVALYIATHGRATNAAGVYQIRQAIVDAAQPQSLWQNANTLDPDTNHEGLAVATLAWTTNAPRFTAVAKKSPGVNVTFTTLNGYTHVVQYLGSLGSFAPWTNLVATNGTGAVISIDDPATDPVRFYRLMTQPVPWPPPDSQVAANLGGLGAAINGQYFVATHGVPGAIAGDAGNSAVRIPLDFNGARVEMPFQTALNTGGPFSIEVWSKPGQTSLSTCVASSVQFQSTKSGWILYQSSSAGTDGNGFSFQCFNTAGATSAATAAADLPVNTNAWYHVAGVFDGVNVVLYVNGVGVATTPLTGGQFFRPNPGANLDFGVRSGSGSGYIGDLDEGAFYTNALSAAQLMSHYQAGTNASPVVSYSQMILNDQPAGYWRFDEP